MHSTTPPRDRAFLVGAELTGDRSLWRAEDSLQELALLADTANLDVVGSMYQRLKRLILENDTPGTGELKEPIT